jgi:serine/threonine-protein kinase
VGLTSGTRLGSYEILALIGTGGMGEVYRARDTKLGRDVAIKTLPELFTQDPERLARFRREAQVLASLNHPHIAHIYGLEQGGQTEFLVLELVEGETLADRLAKGALPLDDALSIAQQMGDALAAAHERGIIHRDLKPANVALTGDGQVKVLDFGLAKALERDPALASADVSATPTITSPAMTALGVILGTAAYMAPEQAKGRPADKRSDIWAFGCVFYEMLTGKRAFDGDDVSDTLAAILRGEPDWTALSTELPINVRVVLTKCLAKDRRQRFADISTPLFFLSEPWIDVGRSSPPAEVSARRGRTASVFVAGAVIAAGLAALVASMLWPKPPRAVVTRFSIPLEEGETFSNMGRQEVAISRDGTSIAYVANARLYARSISNPSPRLVVSGDVARGTITNPVFSPDGQSIAYYWSYGASAGSINRVPTAGGTSQTVCPFDNPYGMSWNGDRLLIGRGDQGLFRVSVNGGTPERIVEVKPGERAYGPQLLPDGDHILFTLATEAGPGAWDSARIIVQSQKTGTRTTVMTGASDARYVPTGRLLYTAAGAVREGRFNLRRLTLETDGVPVLDGVQSSMAGVTAATHYSVSDTGTLAYIPGPAGAGHATTEIATVDRQARVERLQLGLPPANYVQPRVSPVDPLLAVGTDDGKNADIWVCDLSGRNAPRRLTFGGRNRAPVWSGDGARIFFQSDRDGDRAVFWQRADGSGAAERVTHPENGAGHLPQSASRDGKWLLVMVSSGGTAEIHVFSFADRSLKHLGDIKNTAYTSAAFSPDGAFVAYTGPEGTYVQPFPPTGAKYLVMPGIDPFWSRDGNELFTSLRAGFTSVTVTETPAFRFGRISGMARPWIDGPLGGGRNVDIMPDGRHFVAAVDPGIGTQGHLHVDVVVNWFEELKGRTGSK